MKYFIALLLAMLPFSSHAEAKKAVFAGGCFWCMQPGFDNAEGVIRTVVGFSGGDEPNPSYEQVAHGGTGYREAIEVTYDPAKIAYDALLKIYWENIDPFDAGGQFADRGHHYTTAVFYTDDEQKKAAEASKAKLEAHFGKPIATEILPYKNFSAAEEYHQAYYRKNSLHYNMYKKGSGRADGVKKIWGKE